MLGNIKSKYLITPSKYTVKYLELFFVSIHSEINILLTSTSQILTGCFVPQNSSFTTFLLPNLKIIILSKNFVIIIFTYLIQTVF